jgi:hypothetical protein
MRNHTLKYGLFAGGATIACLLLFYIVDPRLVLSAWVIWSTLIFYVVAMALAVRSRRESVEGRLSFREAVRPAFAVFAIANLLYYAFYFLLFNAIDPALADVQRELAPERLERLSWLLGRENTEAMRRNFEAEDFRVTLPGAAFAYVRSLLGGFLLAALVAGVTNRQ